MSLCFHFRGIGIMSPYFPISHFRGIGIMSPYFPYFPYFPLFPHLYQY
jgi:hypothetical protein